MISPVKAVRRVLWGNVDLDGELVPVIKRSYPYDRTPCITVDDSGASTFINRHIITEKYPLQKGHPLYDPEDPFKKEYQQVLREIWQVSLNINVWTDTITEQDTLNDKIIKLFHLAQSDHYLFCDQYHDGNCSYMDNTCYAQHFQESTRGIKCQCPNPSVYGYKNIFTTYNLYRDSFHVDQPFNLDDTSKDNIIYRSVIKLHTAYYTDHIIGGLTQNKVIFKKEEIL
jgi:hypothetical protein